MPGCSDSMGNPLDSYKFVVEVLRTAVFISGMSQALEKRVEELESKVAELSAQVLQLQPPKKYWRRTAGSMPDDEITREAEGLGREYRKQQTHENEIAGS
jgi:hypothetical protein